MKKNTFNIISKITKLFAVGLILCAAIIGCNMGNSVKYGHDSGKARLILSKDAASRLIAPSAVTEDDITKVELFAKLSSASTAPVNPIKTWSSISAMESENRLYIDAGTYDFTLKLYTEVGLCQSGVINNKTVVQGDNQLDFATEYVIDGKGELKITINWTETTKIQKIETALYHFDPTTLTTGSVVAGTSGVVYDDSNTSTHGTAHFSKNQLDDGYYSFVLYLYDSSNCLLNALDYTAKIIAGCTSNTTLTLTGINAYNSLTFVANHLAEWSYEPNISGNSSTILTLPPQDIVTLEGYIFDCWNTEPAGTGTSYNPEQEITISKDTTLYAQWTKGFNVTIVDEQTVLSSLTILDGKGIPAANRPEDPSKDGYTFMGWFDEDTLFNFSSSRITKDTIIKAKYLEHTGAEDDPFLINSIEDWNLIAVLVKNGITFSGKYVKLTQNIGTTGNPITNAIGYWDYQGSSNNNRDFRGTFDGNGKTITVKFNTGATAPFACTYNATIKNLTVNGSMDGGYNGGIAARAQSTNISDCIVNAQIGGYYYPGGFVAESYGNVSIINCIFTGKLAPNAYANCGGFISKCDYNNDTITDCLFDPIEISSSASSGYNWYTFTGDNKGTVTNCYLTRSMGSYQGTMVVKERPDNLYKEVTVLNTILYINMDCQICENVNNTPTSLPETVTYTGSDIDKEFAVVKSGRFLAKDTDYTLEIIKENGDSVTEISECGAYTIVVTGVGENKGGLSKTLYVTKALEGDTNSSDEAGSENNPYLINNMADWYTFSKSVTADNSYEGKFFKLTANIGSNDNPVTTTVGTPNNSQTPIFMGSFDGNGKTITVNISSGQKSNALFPYVNNATIKNLTLKGQINCIGEYCAPLIGNARNNTTVDGCTIDAEISINMATSLRAAGVIGYYYGDAGNYLTIKNTKFTGKISGSNNNTTNSGFVGCNWSSQIKMENCLFEPAELAVAGNWTFVWNNQANTTRPVTEFTNCYYTQPFGDIQEGSLVSADSNALGTPITSGIAAGYTKVATIEGLRDMYIDYLSNGDPDESLGNTVGNMSYAVKLGDTTLTPGTDYTAVIKNDAGQTFTKDTIVQNDDYTLTITGNGSYSGSISKKFKVSQQLQGSGTEEAPYLINNMADWDYFARSVSSDSTYTSPHYYSNYVKLTADIGSTSNPVTTMAGVWDGNDSGNAFKGIFDGDNHTITINYNTGNTVKGTALFRCLYYGTLKNLKVAGTITTSTYYAGGIVGYSRNVVLENCSSSVDIISTSTSTSGIGIGGIIGNSQYACTLKNCAFTGSLVSPNWMEGGLISSSWSSGSSYAVTVTNCLFAPKEIPTQVLGNDSKTFVNNSDATISSCYYTQPYGVAQGLLAVKASDPIPANANCIMVSKRLADGNTYIVEEPITLDGFSEFYDYNNGSPVSITYTVKDSAGDALVSGSDYTAVIKDYVGRTVSSVTAAGEYVLEISGRGSYSGKKNYPFSVQKVLTGSGTEDDPYLIEDLVDWDIFADKVNKGYTFQNEYVQLAADIGTVSTMAGCYNESDTSKQKSFNGTFDGDGHTITINFIKISYDYCGPIGYIKGATIKNLTVAGCINSSKSFAGGFVGMASGNKNYFTNCDSRVELIFPTGSATQPRSGGFVGKNKTSTYFDNCTFSGRYTGDWSNSGAFVGSDDSVTYITNCLFAPTNQAFFNNDNFALFSSMANVTNSYYTENFSVAGIKGIKAYTTLAAAQSDNYSVIEEKTFAGNHKVFVPVLSGEGTQSNPYRIATIGDWNIVSQMVQGKDNFNNKFVKLTADIGTSSTPVTTMIGTYNDGFSGTFDADGHAITVSYTVTGTSMYNPYAAPFKNIKGATIKNLIVHGSITTDNQYAGGIVGRAQSYWGERGWTVTDCVSDVTITYNGSNSTACVGGGLVGSVESYGSIKNCVFGGKLLSQNDAGYGGGLIGYCSSNNITITLTNCLFAPQEVTVPDSGSNTFVVGGTISQEGTCYYTEHFGTESFGERVYISIPQGADADDYEEITITGNYKCYKRTLATC